MADGKVERRARKRAKKRKITFGTEEVRENGGDPVRRSRRVQAHLDSRRERRAAMIVRALGREG